MAKFFILSWAFKTIHFEMLGNIICSKRCFLRYFEQDRDRAILFWSFIFFNIFKTLFAKLGLAFTQKYDNHENKILIVFEFREFFSIKLIVLNFLIKMHLRSSRLHCLLLILENGNRCFSEKKVGTHLLWDYNLLNVPTLDYLRMTKTSSSMKNKILRKKKKYAKSFNQSPLMHIKGVFSFMIYFLF